MTRKTTTTARTRTRTRTGLTVLTAAMIAAPAVGAATAAPAAARESVRDCAVTDFAIAETDRRAAAGTAYIEFTMTRTGEGETPAGGALQPLPVRRPDLGGRPGRAGRRLGRARGRERLVHH